MAYRSLKDNCILAIPSPLSIKCPDIKERYYVGPEVLKYADYADAKVSWSEVYIADDAI